MEPNLTITQTNGPSVVSVAIKILNAPKFCHFYSPGNKTVASFTVSNLVRLKDCSNEELTAILLGGVRFVKAYVCVNGPDCLFSFIHLVAYSSQDNDYCLVK